MKKIIIIILVLILVMGIGFLSLSTPELKLKNQLSKGCYESPYIIRPLKDITVNGVSVGEYKIVAPENAESLVYSYAADTLNRSIYLATGKKIEVGSTNEKAFVIEEKLNNDHSFSLTVKGGNVYLKGSSRTGISRGITAFYDEVLLKEKGTFDFKDGYEYIKTFTDYVTYEDFGAVGDGKADDFSAIVKAHDHANERGLTVFANETATYYIGGKNKTATIKTNTDWSTARFIIDDTRVEERGAWVFSVTPSAESVNITEKLSALKIDADNIGTKLNEKSLVVLTDSNVKRYVRKGANQNSGSNQTDIIIADKNGNISADTPLIWGFNEITDAVAYPMDTEKLTIKGGHFTTIANNAESEYNYYARGIVVKRSNTVIDGLYHIIESEGKTGSPYSAFVSLSHCADVTVKNCTFTGHKKYQTIGSGGTSVSMGTYDIGAAMAINASFVNCNQTNDITDIDYWGIAGTNYCKNLVYDGCAFSRFDAHQGVLNATVKNSVLGHHGIKLIGKGTAIVENTTVLSDSFIDLRSDYGSTWEGDVVIRNCKFYPKGISRHIIKAENSEDHNFGYTCYLPQRVMVDGLYVHRIGNSYMFNNVNKNHKSQDFKSEYPVVTPKEITVKGYDSLIFGKAYASENSEMIDVEVTE